MLGDPSRWFRWSWTNDSCVLVVLAPEEGMLLETEPYCRNTLLDKKTALRTARMRSKNHVDSDHGSGI